jgi:hypothetical protein
MRINIYSEEITTEVETVVKKSDTGNEFTGIRFILESSDKLHHNPNDDDRSAITFWVPGSLKRGYRSEQLTSIFRKAIGLLEALPQ